jgi:hypothetical protein
VPAVVCGGVATIVVALSWTRLFPSLARLDRMEDLRPPGQPVADEAEPLDAETAVAGEWL